MEAAVRTNTLVEIFLSVAHSSPLSKSGPTPSACQRSTYGIWDSSQECRGITEHAPLSDTRPGKCRGSTVNPISRNLNTLTTGVISYRGTWRASASAKTPGMVHSAIIISLANGKAVNAHETQAGNDHILDIHGAWTRRAAHHAPDWPPLLTGSEGFRSYGCPHLLQCLFLSQVGTGDDPL